MKILASMTLAWTLILLQTPATANSEGVHVLIDFGEGTYFWTDVQLGGNRTAFNVTETAARNLELNITYTWSTYGVFVQDIGDRRPIYPLYWHLFIWNGTDAMWEMSDLGASSLILSDGAAIGWSLAKDKPGTMQSPLPLPTPPSPYPHLYFRHDASNSGSYTGSLCTEYAPGWEYDTGSFEISGTPAEFGGTLFVPTWSGLFAIDSNEGSLVWKREDVRGMSSPAAFNDGLLLGGSDGKLHYLAAKTGEEIWNVSLLPSPVYTGIASSPKPYYDKVYVGLFEENGGEGGVVAVNVWNGSVIWRHGSPSIHMSSPAADDSTIYIGVAGIFNGSSNSFAPPHGLLALDASTGSERWLFETQGPVASSPLLLGSKVYFTSRDGLMHALNLDGSEAWNSSISPSTSSPATDGDKLFVADGVLGGSGSVMAYSLTGQRLWRTELTGPVQSSPLYADSVLFVATNEAQGTLYAVDVQDGKILWEFTPTPGDYILSYPVVADGDLYVASDNGVVYQIACQPTRQGWGPVAYAGIVIGALTVVAGFEAVVLIFRRRQKK